MLFRIVFLPKYVEIDDLTGVCYIRNHLSDHFKPAFKVMPGVYYLPNL